MTQPFAKLFETELGQIVVMLREAEEGDHPEVRFFAQPDGLGVCSLALGWDDDSDESWGKAESAFEKVDEESAMTAVRPIFQFVDKETP